jgi:hypothetical protein
MKIIAFTAAVLALIVAGLPAAAQEPSAKLAASSRVKIKYEPPRDAYFKPIHDKLKNLEVLERLQQFLAPLRLPRDIEVRTAQCGTPSKLVFYQPFKARQPVTICYDYVQLIENMAPKEGFFGVVSQLYVTRDTALTGPFVQEVLHNVALATFEALDVPIWGRQTDAADHVAALLMLQFGTDVAMTTVIGSAYFLNQSNRYVTLKRDKDGKPVTDDKGNTISVYANDYLADVRPPMIQRYYNLLCMATGHSLPQFSIFVAHNRPQTILDLALKDARSCHWVHKKVLEGFKATIFDKYIDKDLLKEARSIDWLHK